MMKLRLALLSATLFFTSCINHPLPYDWSQYKGPGEEYFQREEVEFPIVHDTFEPLNRTMWGINERLAEHVLDPFGRGYRTIVPGAVRLGLRNFFANALFPGRLVNNLLQGKVSGAWDETKRFGLNTTVGVLGFRDVAQNKYGILPSQEDFGQTFAKWGWRDSSYLMIPFYGPRTFRDVIGGLGDYAIDPAVYCFPAAPVRGSNKMSDEVRGLLEFLNSNYDPYELARLLYVMNRENDALDYSYEAEQSGVTDTLGAIFLAPEDPEFVNRSEERSVLLSTTGKRFPYSVWLQDEPSPLVYLIPGTGGHRNSSSSVALAEAAFSEGNSVVTVSNALNYEFMEYALTEELPGTMPSDSRDLHVALDAIDRDLQAHATHRLTNRYLGGLSLGALATLFIAAAEGSTDLIAFDAYIAVNAPVSLRYSIEQLDQFYNAPLEYPYEVRSERIDGIFRKTLDLAQGTLAPGAEGLPPSFFVEFDTPRQNLYRRYVGNMGGNISVNDQINIMPS
ncbi:MAG: VacJ family lipoprotein, partial [Planctomycetota bacterium]